MKIDIIEQKMFKLKTQFDHRFLFAPRYQSLLWLSLLILGTVHCYFYTLFFYPEAESILHSFSWAILRWLPWFLVSPFLCKTLFTVYQRTHSATTFLKLLAITCLCAVCTATSFAFFINNFSLPLPYQIYDYWLTEIPLTVVIMALLVGLTKTQKVDNLKASEQTANETKTVHCDYFIVDSHQGTQRINLEHLLCISASGNYLELVTANGVSLYRETMKNVVKDLPGNFIRVHRSHIVNKRHVLSVKSNKQGGYTLTLTDNRLVEVSRSFVKTITSENNLTFKQAILSL